MVIWSSSALQPSLDEGNTKRLIGLRIKLAPGQLLAASNPHHHLLPDVDNKLQGLSPCASVCESNAFCATPCRMRQLTCSLVIAWRRC